jgi:hypothetical protein
VDGQSDRGCAATASPQGAWSCLGPDLEAGLHNADAVATDAAGNTSPPSLEIGFLVDLDGPDRPFISSPADGDQLSARAPAFQGSGEPGALLRVTLGALEVCAGVTINPQGQWACRAVVDLSDGPYTATATAADAFGRDSDPSPTVSFLIDTLAPAPPALTDPANDAILTNNQPTLSGDTEPLARVTLSLEGQADPLCDALADDQGAFSCISQQTLTEGAHRVVGVARDGAGNVSAPSAPSRFLVDTDGDADGDGLPNAWEEREGFDPLDPGDADDDPDEDGLTALQEFMAGTAPRDGDSDDDGVIDGVEPRWSEDTDGDGLINALDPDSDDDGLLDGVERGVLAPTRFTDSARGHFQADADPATTTDPLARDSDGGGAPDGVEDWDLNGRQ